MQKSTAMVEVGLGCVVLRQWKMSFINIHFGNNTWPPFNSANSVVLKSPNMKPQKMRFTWLFRENNERTEVEKSSICVCVHSDKYYHKFHFQTHFFTLPDIFIVSSSIRSYLRTNQSKIVYAIQFGFIICDFSWHVIARICSFQWNAWSFGCAYISFVRRCSCLCSAFVSSASLPLQSLPNFPCFIFVFVFALCTCNTVSSLLLRTIFPSHLDAHYQFSMSSVRLSLNIFHCTLAYIRANLISNQISNVFIWFLCALFIMFFFLRFFSLCLSFLFDCSTFY